MSPPFLQVQGLTQGWEYEHLEVLYIPQDLVAAEPTRDRAV